MVIPAPVGLSALVTNAFTSMVTTLWPSVMAIHALVVRNVLVTNVYKKKVPLRLGVMEMVLLAAEAHNVMVHVPAKLVV